MNQAMAPLDIEPGTGLNAGHDDRIVHRVRIGTVEVIRKRYAIADAAQVHASMVALWASPFGATRTTPGMPEPLGLSDDGTTIDMELLDGPMLGTRGDTGLLPELVDEVALLLADLHRSGVVVPQLRSAPRLVASLERKFRGDRHPVLDALAAAVPDHEQLAVAHGDCSPRNVVVTARGPVLIDFDRLQMAGAGRDVQYMAAWAWVTDVLAGRTSVSAGWDLGDRFEAAYAAHRPEARAELDATRRFHRASGLVRIAMSWSSLKRDAAARERVIQEATDWLHGRR